MLFIISYIYHHHCISIFFKLIISFVISLVILSPLSHSLFFILSRLYCYSSFLLLFIVIVSYPSFLVSHCLLFLLLYLHLHSSFLFILIFPPSSLLSFLCFYVDVLFTSHLHHTYSSFPICYLNPLSSPSFVALFYVFFTFHPFHSLPSSLLFFISVFTSHLPLSHVLSCPLHRLLNPLSPSFASLLRLLHLTIITFILFSLVSSLPFFLNHSRLHHLSRFLCCTYLPSPSSSSCSHLSFSLSYLLFFTVSHHHYISSSLVTLYRPLLHLRSLHLTSRFR